MWYPCRAVEKGATTRSSSSIGTPSTTATSAAARPAMSAGDFLVVGPDWKGEAPAGIKGVLRSSSQFTIAIIRTQLVRPGRHAERRQNPGRIPGETALGVSQTTRAARRCRRLISPRQRPARQDEFFRLLEFVMQLAHPAPRKWTSAPSSRASAWGRQEVRLQGSPARAQGRRARRRESRHGESAGAHGQPPSASASMAGRSAPHSATAISTRATGCSAPPPPRPASSATTPRKPSIP
jgi:hypothetical protein